MMNAAMMVGLGLLAQWGLPRIVPGFGQPQAGAPPNVPRLPGVEPTLPPDAYAGLVRAVTPPTAVTDPKILDMFELDLLRANFPGAAKVARDKAAELRAAQAQRAAGQQNEQVLQAAIAAGVAKALSDPKMIEKIIAAQKAGTSPAQSPAPQSKPVAVPAATVNGKTPTAPPIVTDEDLLAASKTVSSPFSGMGGGKG